MKKPLLFLFIFALLIHPSFSLFLTNKTLNFKPDGYRLHLQWPSSYCYSGKTCVPFRKASFTIHALYPLDSNNLVIGCPQPYPPLPTDAVKDVEEELKNDWPDLLGDNLGFWTREWQKYGSCHDTWTAEDFFKNVLHARKVVNTTINDQYDACLLEQIESVHCALVMNGIIPGGSYTQTDFFDAFTWMLNKGIGLKCKGRNKNNRLLEIIFCFDDKLILKTCTDLTPLTENCQNNILYVPDTGSLLNRSIWERITQRLRDVLFVRVGEAGGDDEL